MRSESVAIGLPGRYQGSQRYEVTGKLWPHGAFSVGVCPAGEGYVASPSRAFVVADHEVAGPEWAQLDLLDASKRFTLPDSPNSHIEPERPDTYGRKGITSFGKNMVRAGAFELQRAVSMCNLSFLTLTLPPLDPFYGRAIAESWGKVLNRFYQWLSRRLRGGGVRDWIVGATEVQPKRGGRGDVCALHCHILFQGRLSRSHDWVVSRADVKEAWERILSACAGVPVESRYRPYLKSVEYDAVGYIGKYMSKGSAAIGEIVKQHGWQCIPRQWWTMSASMRAVVKRSVRKGRVVGEVLESVISAYLSGVGVRFPGMLMAHFIEGGGGAVLSGYSGYLDPVVDGEVRDMLSAVGYP